MREDDLMTAQKSVRRRHRLNSKRLARAQSISKALWGCRTRRPTRRVAKIIR